MPRRLHIREPDFEAAFQALLAAKRESAPDVAEVVAEIIADVRARGDAALIELTERYDRVVLSAGELLITADEVDAAARQVAEEDLAALTFAARRIEDYHRRQLPADERFTDAAGVTLGHRWTPLEAAGIYVPGGLAAYPSSVLMNAQPARVAGVARIAMAVPTPDGVLRPLVAAAAQLVGIEEIYRIGGAQAIAALAYGSESVASVDKIIGPGNAYVAQAKAQVFGHVGIDMIAGPSEILVVADKANDPAWIAADLISQAEHDTAAQAILLSDDGGFADRVEAAVEAELAHQARAKIARASWQNHGAIILVDDLAGQAPALIDRIAAEHVELALEQPEAEAMLARIRHAGAVFLGRHTPEAVGDYVAGTNHVLPTSRGARFASGLTVLDFMKRTAIVGCDAAALAKIAPAAVTLARAEGLEAHARSLTIRLD